MGKARLSPWRSFPIGTLLLPLLLLMCVLYFLIFAADINAYDRESGLFQYALNDHDHFVYVFTIDRIRSTGLAYELNNDIGIAIIYAILAWLFPFFVDEHFVLLSLLFNCLVLCCCYWTYAKICERLQLGVVGKLSFFANTYFVYFAQLINKDLLTILAFLIAVLTALNGRLLALLFLLPVLALVRQQLALFALIFVYLAQTPRPIPRIGWLYVVTSLVAGMLSAFASVIGEDSLGGGFSAYLVEFNQQYYIGYLLFNPLRVLQYVLDAFASFSFWTEIGGIDMAKLLRLPQLVVIVLLLKPLSTLVTRFNDSLKTPAKPLALAVVAYLLAWLMNPTINARYVMLITPVLVLFALHARKYAHRRARR